MATVNTHADSIEPMNTGASSHEAAQTDPDLGLGNYLASTLAPAHGKCLTTTLLDGGAETVV